MLSEHKNPQKSTQQRCSQQKGLRSSRQVENVSSFVEIRSLSIIKLGNQQEPPSESCPERNNLAGMAPRRSKRRKLFQTQKKSNPKHIQADHGTKIDLIFDVLHGKY
jgi:hypothetical protein